MTMLLSSLLTIHSSSGRRLLKARSRGVRRVHLPAEHHSTDSGPCLSLGRPIVRRCQAIPAAGAAPYALADQHVSYCPLTPLRRCPSPWVPTSRRHTGSPPRPRLPTP